MNAAAKKFNVEMVAINVKWHGDLESIKLDSIKNIKCTFTHVWDMSRYAMAMSWVPPPKNLILKWLLSTKSDKGSVGILCLAHVHSLYSPVWNHFQNLISGYTVVLNTLNVRCQHDKLSVGNLCTAFIRRCGTTFKISFQNV